VLRGLGLNPCRPKVITIEGWTSEERRTQSEFLKPLGYQLNQFNSLVSLFARMDDLRVPVEPQAEYYR
jgi:hypothetical protein